MVRAFGVLQEQREEGGEPVVTQASWNQLVRLVQPNLSNAHRELLWSVSDDKNQGAIGEWYPNQHTHLKSKTRLGKLSLVKFFINTQDGRDEIYFSLAGLLAAV